MVEFIYLQVHCAKIGDCCWCFTDTTATIDAITAIIVPVAIATCTVIVDRYKLQQQLCIRWSPPPQYDVNKRFRISMPFPFTVVLQRRRDLFNMLLQAARSFVQLPQQQSNSASGSTWCQSSNRNGDASCCCSGVSSKAA